MTISTVTFQNDAVYDIESIESQVSQTQNQLSTGLTLQNAADNPVAMSEVNDLNVELSASQQYQSNASSANTSLELEEQALTDATDTIQSAQSLATEANDGSLTSADQQDIATQLQQLLEQLVATANSTDSNGNYLFSGTASGTQPFADSGSGVTYSGSESVNQIEIASDQSISQGDTGSSVFMNIPAGNGTFVTAAGAANTGTASIDTGSVTDPSTWENDAGTFTISFTSATQYQVTNADNDVVTSGTYTSGNAISFDGIQVTISGTPATGDDFTVSPAGTSSVFSTLSNLISALDSTTLTSGQLTTAINTAEQQLSNAVSNIDDVQASVGARIDAITSAQTSATSTQTTLQTSISNLSDTDDAAATTQLSTEELALQAAEESYASIAKLSLFDYLS